MWTSSLPTEMMSTVQWRVSCGWSWFGLMSINIGHWNNVMQFTVTCRDRARHDVCNKPGNGHVLGNVTLERHGNHGEGHFMKISGLRHKFRLSFCFYSVLLTRRRTQLHASSTWYRPCVSRQSITTSRGIKWRCSFQSSTTKSVRVPSTLPNSSVFFLLYFTHFIFILFHCDVSPCSAVSGVGAMTWSPLACGLITGKYSDGVPECSRAAMKVSLIWPALLGDSSRLNTSPSVILSPISGAQPCEISTVSTLLSIFSPLKGYQWLKERVNSEEGRRQLVKIKELHLLADRLGCTAAQLAIGKVQAVLYGHVSSVASSVPLQMWITLLQSTQHIHYKYFSPLWLKKQKEEKAWGWNLSYYILFLILFIG